MWRLELRVPTLAYRMRQPDAVTGCGDRQGARHTLGPSPAVSGISRPHIQSFASLVYRIMQ